MTNDTDTDDKNPKNEPAIDWTAVAAKIRAGEYTPQELKQIRDAMKPWEKRLGGSTLHEPAAAAVPGEAMLRKAEPAYFGAADIAAADRHVTQGAPDSYSRDWLTPPEEEAGKSLPRLRREELCQRYYGLGYLQGKNVGHEAVRAALEFRALRNRGLRLSEDEFVHQSLQRLFKGEELPALERLQK